MTAISTEVLLTGLSLATLAGYHLWLWRCLKHRPASTAIGRHRLARQAWTVLVRGGKRDILVVQTLRNWIMSSTFMASTAILFALGLVGVAFTTDRLSVIAHELNFMGSTSSGLLLFKILLLVVDFLIAFFCFSLAIRTFIHTGFTLNLQLDEPPISSTEAVHEFERGALNYTLGMRCYYLALPLALWLFGPAWLLFGSILLVIVLRRID